MTPKHFIKETPKKLQRAKKSLFNEDTGPVSDSDEGDSTLSYASKVTNKKPKVFKFRKFSPRKKDENNSPGSLPSLPSGSPIVISSDEELERSIIELERSISLEMESD